jgi:hypothetical protein
MAIGDPHTRPEEETVFVPNSYAIARDAQDWEACALVPWAMHLPPHAGAHDIECLITEKLNLQLGDLAVTLHQPEPYLIRFVHQHHAAAAKSGGASMGEVLTFACGGGAVSRTLLVLGSSTGSDSASTGSHPMCGRRTSSKG